MAKYCMFFTFLVLHITFSYPQITKIKNHLKEGEYEEVIEILENKATAAGLSDEERYIYARAKIGLIELNEAEAILKQLLEKDPDNHLYLSSLAEIFLQRGEIDKSEKILKGVKDHPRKLYILGTIYFLKGHTDYARSFFSRIPIEATEHLDAKGIMKSAKSVSADLFITAGYDSNPTIAPQAGFISRRETTAYQAKGSLTYFGWRTRLDMYVGYTLYNKVRNFNTLTGLLSASYTMGKVVIPLRADYITLGGRFYRTSGEAGIGYFLGKLKVLVLAGYYEYYATTISEENRDGPRYTARIELPINLGRMVSRIGLTGGYEDTKGKNWRNLFVQPTVSAGFEAGKISFYLAGTLAYYTYQAENTLYLKRRRDLYLSVEPVIRIRFFGPLVGEIRYSFSQNASTIRELGYIRHTVYAGLGGSF